MILDLNILARKPRIKKIEGNIAKASRKTKQVTWQGSIVQTVPEFSIATLGAKIVSLKKQNPIATGPMIEKMEHRFSDIHCFKIPISHANFLRNLLKDLLQQN